MHNKRKQHYANRYLICGVKLIHPLDIMIGLENVHTLLIVYIHGKYQRRVV